MKKVMSFGKIFGQAIVTATKATSVYAKHGPELFKCEHDWSDEILTFHNRDGEMTKKEFLSLPDDDKEQLHVSGGCVACCKCGISWKNNNNPDYIK